MRLNGWQRFGTVLSVAWLFVSSWGYFHELWNHPSGLTTYLPHAAYEWIPDLDATQKAHEDALQNGKDFSNQFVFLKPIFDIYGFIIFIPVPVVVSWFVVYLVLCTFRWVRHGFQT